MICESKCCRGLGKIICSEKNLGLKELNPQSLLNVFLKLKKFVKLLFMWTRKLSHAPTHGNSQSSRKETSAFHSSSFLGSTTNSSYNSRIKTLITEQNLCRQSMGHHQKGPQQLCMYSHDLSQTGSLFPIISCKHHQIF